MSSPRPTVFEPARLGPLTLRNRIVKAATFEGVMPRGAVSDELVEFHAEVARGGTALTTVAYCSVSHDGRVHRDTLVLDADSVPGLTRLTDAVHAAGGLASSQIGHAGLVANQISNKMKTLAPSTRISAPAMGLVRGATLEQLDRVVEDYARAARFAVEAGFDAVEVHLGHNYLLSSFMSPNLNKRSDKYGGSIEGRTAFPRRVLEAVRTAVGEGVAVIAKFNMTDGVPQGLWLDESLPMAKLIESDGTIHAMQLTGGSSLLNGMYFFRGDVPMKEFQASQPKVVGWGLKVYGPKIFPKLPFEEAFFLPMARQFREELKIPLILLGGINRLDTIETALDEGFEFVAMGRALLRDPYLVRKFEEKTAHEGLCIHCNKCMPTIYTGTRCVIRETLRDVPGAA
ncbi:NADH:flavin oxidoreductase [Rhodococcus sp. p52]|uniref:NADH:flavin oxidoreductase n=1 Tax=Rhodococcus TaxID=1827 RepID=UPI00051A636D|nr:NADH:flavin oxidoreductase [Rhodococcus sp. p52]AOD21288.1 NADH:flavin oxidoreductase [Rhodococcus sp. p52]